MLSLRRDLIFFDSMRTLKMSSDILGDALSASCTYYEINMRPGAVEEMVNLKMTYLEVY